MSWPNDTLFVPNLRVRTASTSQFDRSRVCNGHLAWGGCSGALNVGERYGIAEPRSERAKLLSRAFTFDHFRCCASSRTGGFAGLRLQSDHITFYCHPTLVSDPGGDAVSAACSLGRPAR